MLPDLFREGQGVVTEGVLEPGGTLRADYLRRFADAQSVLDACLDAAGIRHARHYTDQPLDLPLRRLFGALDAAEYA